MKQRTRLMNGDDLMSYNMSKKTDGDVNGAIALHRVKPPEHFIEAQIQEGDTLQAIALRFYCSISELKRINQIHKDNEIFARRTIKVPVTPYSVLTELISAPPPLEPAPSTSGGAQLNTSQNLLLDNTHSKVQINESNNTSTKDDFAIDCNAVVLNSTLTPSVIPYTDVEPSDCISEDTQLLPNKTRDPVETVIVKELTSHGADLGLKWSHLFVLILVLCIVAPILYVLLFVDKHVHTDLPPLAN